MGERLGTKVLAGFIVVTIMQSPNKHPQESMELGQKRSIHKLYNVIFPISTRSCAPYIRLQIRSLRCAHSTKSILYYRSTSTSLVVAWDCHHHLVVEVEDRDHWRSQQ